MDYLYNGLGKRVYVSHARRHDGVTGQPKMSAFDASRAPAGTYDGSYTDHVCGRSLTRI